MSSVSTSLTSDAKFSDSGVSSSVVRLPAFATGVSLTGLTVICTVAGSESSVPALTV